MDGQADGRTSDARRADLFWSGAELLCPDIRTQKSRQCLGFLANKDRTSAVKNQQYANLSSLDIKIL